MGQSEESARPVGASRAAWENPGPGTPEDGGHHARYEPPQDGVFNPDWNTITVAGYVLIDREHYADAVIEHLPRLNHRVSHYEYSQLPNHYRVMYVDSLDYWELESHWVKRWGKQ